MYPVTEIRSQFLFFLSLHGLKSVQLVVGEHHGVEPVRVDRAPVGVPEDLPEAVIVEALNQVRVHQARPKVSASEICKHLFQMFVVVLFTCSVLYGGYLTLENHPFTYKY